LVTWLNTISQSDGILNLTLFKGGVDG